ncbi:MAG: dual specificity protein phosphatase family protein [Verrucomicrobia bacterium]|nr:dual specificity protein phosphatase family protein [Verrucomicrobiota bacterium]MBS0637566.1 dual specificity protein phosphatase family protein [Verrucomicrobiota bacterium]
MAVWFYKRPPVESGPTHFPTYNRKSDWYLSPHKCLKKFQVSCEELSKTANSTRRSKKAFKAVKRASKRIHRSFLTAAQYRKKNRHKHLAPYDETRSCQDLANFYINANDVETPLQTYMVAQGPLENTVEDFWQAVLHKNSNTIVTLVMAIEEGREKCASYWTRPVVAAGEWTITLQGEKVVATSIFIPSHRIVIRTFSATNGTEIRSIKQVHYENWPDGKVPDLDLFIKLLDVVDELKPKGPITVHCSAGIGRSGTFVAAHSLRKELRQAESRKRTLKPLLVNVPKAVFLLRCQRLGMVGSTAQFKTVCQAIAREYRPRTKPFFLVS